MNRQLITVTSILTASLLVASTGMRAAEDPPEGEVTVSTPSTASGAGAKEGVSPAVVPSASEQGHKFIGEAARGNMAEIRLGELAQQQADSAEVREYGARLAEDHRQANEKLLPIAQNNDVAWPIELKVEDQQLVDRLSELSGNQFDEKFMKASLKAHEKDVQKYEKMAGKIEVNELDQYVQETLPVLRDHLARAREIAGQSAH